MIDPDAPFTMGEVIASLEARQPGYADAVATVDDLVDILTADIGRANPHMNIPACRDAALAALNFVLLIAGPPRGGGDADDDPQPRPREPVGGGGSWG